nr:arginine--tRNA ligase, chloroplastic/mitochondrial [Tanacetum cinerariifolium]
MKPLTFDDTHNMVAFLSKFDASEGFDQIVYFLNAHAIQYALVVNPTIYVSCIKQFWAMATIKKGNDVVQLRALIDGKKVVVLEDVIRRDLHLHDRIHPNEGEIEAIDADEDLTLVDMETQKEVFSIDAEPQGRIYQEKVNAASKGVSAAELTVFDYEKCDDKEENIDWNVIAEQIQERHLENIRKYQSLKKKPISLAQARKNMIIYLKNMAGYKMEYFRGLTYDKVRPIFKREYKKVQTLFKPDKDVEEPKKKRVAEETLPQESFKKLKAVKVTGSESTQEIPFSDPKEMSEEDVQNMLEIVLMSEFKVEALQVRYHIIDWEIHTEGYAQRIKENLVALWNLVKEKFSSAVPSVNKEKALWVELKRLFEPDVDDVIWKLQSDEDLHGGQQTKEQKFGYILQVIKMLKLKKRDVYLGINVAGSSITAAGSRLMLLGKVDTAAEAEPVVKTSRLLMCKATTVLLDLLRYMKPPMDVYAPVTVEVGVEPYRKEQKMVEIEQKAKTPLDLEIVNPFITPFVFSASDPLRKSWFEVFLIRPFITTDYGGTHLFEPDFPYVALFNHEWSDPINIHQAVDVCLGNPSSHLSVPFSSSIQIYMELYVTTKDKDDCFQLCNHKFKLDLTNFWDEKSYSRCGILMLKVRIREQ